MSAVVRSVANIPHTRYNQGTLLNQKLDPLFAHGEKSVEALMAYLKTLCSLGVFHVQFNVVDEELLRDAQVHPEDHNDLLIRVASYTAFFTELGPETQGDIISRTTQTSLMFAAKEALLWNKEPFFVLKKYLPMTAWAFAQ